MRNKHWYTVTINGVSRDTKAVSEAQAINNVRWLVEGCKPLRYCTVCCVRKFDSE